MKEIHNTAIYIELLKRTRAKFEISNKDYLWLSAQIFALEIKLQKQVNKLYKPSRIKGHQL